MLVEDLIKKLQEYPPKAAVAAPLWFVDAVEQQAKDDKVKLQEGEAEKVLAMAEKYQDANEGINWTVISCHIDTVVSERGQNADI